MAHKPVFHPTAEEEVIQAHAWYAERSIFAAQAFAHEVDLMVRRVLDSPGQYPSYLPGTQRAVFPRFPYSLIFRLSGDVVEVIAIAHQRRRPGYWRAS